MALTKEDLEAIGLVVQAQIGGVHEEVRSVREELHLQIGSIRGEFQAQVGVLRDELGSKIDHLRVEFTEFRDKTQNNFDGVLKKMETYEQEQFVLREQVERLEKKCA